MKWITCFLFLWFSISASAQPGASEDTFAAPAITKAGIPEGRIAKVRISKDGGQLLSADGIVELVFSSGALSKKTDISIQPISNEMPNGNGKAYRLEPSGILFQKSIQLVFHYDEGEHKDSMQLLLGIAMQDEKGQWLSLRTFTLDTVAKTISGNISHFSDWSNFSAMKIYPSYKRLKVNKSKMLFIIGVSPSHEDGGNNVLAPLVKTKNPKQVVWKVNSIKGGNATFGTVNRIDDKVGHYFSPDAVPVDGNPVAVTAKLIGLTYETIVNGKTITFKNLRLVSNLLIYDNAYEVLVTRHSEGNAGSELGAVAYDDSSRFVINLNGKDTKIIEKENKNTNAAWGYDGKCAIRKLRSGTGDVHIIGAKRIDVTPPKTAGSGPWVNIEFIWTPCVMPLLEMKCPPVGSGKEWYTNTTAFVNARMIGIQAFPQRLRFEAKAGEHVAEEYAFLENYYKVVVKQLKEDE